MLDLFDEDFDEMELVEGALVLNKAINPDTRVEWAEQELSRLLKDAESQLVSISDEKQRFDTFLNLFYTEWGFSGDRDAYYESRNAFIDKVLQHRKGVPVSLGALLLYFGRKLGFPVQGVTFPTQFLLQVNWEGEAVHK